MPCVAPGRQPYPLSGSNLHSQAQIVSPVDAWCSVSGSKQWQRTVTTRFLHNTPARCIPGHLIMGASHPDVVVVTSETARLRGMFKYVSSRVLKYIHIYIYTYIHIYIYTYIHIYIHIHTHTYTHTTANTTSIEHGSRVREIVGSNPWSNQSNDVSN